MQAKGYGGGMENSELARFAEDVARGAGEILRRNYGRVQSVHYKGEINLVTEVDRRSEAYIMERIRSSFPDHGILSEESPEILSSSAYRWIVDPLDGTTNFAHGYPCFCVSIAVEREGKLLAGAVFDPLLSEMFTAMPGAGAFRNGERIRVSATDNLRRSLLATGFAYDVKTSTENNLDYFREFVFTGQAIRRDGSAALDMCYLASGRFDGFWELSLRPWDTAAGLLILAEAGGVATRLDGSPYDIHQPDILASNGRIHEQMLAIVRKAKGDHP
ncbi:MAG TPA: inositol monophosphatase family protein [Candidatus Limnocylindrales bacterium]|nr:inositol monophosphatase family protein [Candidatus Limnocylindrales bacterium]